MCLRSMRDYSVDKRGDVGSWIRDVSMHALTNLITDLARNRTIVLVDLYLAYFLLALSYCVCIVMFRHQTRLC